MVENNKRKFISFILFSILLVSFNSFCQNYNYGRWSYYKGYEAGFNKACGCSKRFQIFDSGGTYNDGYSAGYTDGRIYVNDNRQQENTSTYSPSNYDLLYYGLQQKQQKYNTRLEDLKTMMFNLVYYMKEKQKEYKNELPNNLVEYYQKSIKTLSSYANYDLSDDYIYAQIRDNYEIFKKSIISW